MYQSERVAQRQSDIDHENEGSSGEARYPSSTPPREPASGISGLHAELAAGRPEGIRQRYPQPNHLRSPGYGRVRETIRLALLDPPPRRRLGPTSFRLSATVKREKRIGPECVPAAIPTRCARRSHGAAVPPHNSRCHKYQ